MTETDPRFSTTNGDGEAKNYRLTAYLDEYKICAVGYRHTYQTIWQIGAIAAVISGGMLTFGADKWMPVGTKLAPWAIGFLSLVASIPILVWFAVFYRPMDNYARQKAHRLIVLEELIATESGAQLMHFTSFFKQATFPETMRVTRGVRWRLTRVIQGIVLLIC